MANNYSKADLVKKLEIGLLPDEEFKRLVRTALDQRHHWIKGFTYQQRLAQTLNLVQSMRQTNNETERNAYNPEEYEIPISFVKIMHGKALKMSWCYFEDDSMTLDDAEIAMLDLYCERAQIKDGDKVLDLGCGTGSFTLHVARKYPRCHVTGITDTTSTKDYIEEQCKNHSLGNVEIILADITTYEMDRVFDRVMVISVMEHLKNYQSFLRKISKWMKQDGLLFIDQMCHSSFAYEMKPITEEDWLEDFIFSGMPVTISSPHLLLYFQDDVSIVNQWILSGKHLSRTHEEWLKKLDNNADAAKAVIKTFMNSEDEVAKMFNGFRVFCLHGIEQGNYNNGEEWMTAHLLFKKK